MNYEGMRFDIKVNADHPVIVIHYYEEQRLLSVQGYYQKALADLSTVKHSHLKTIVL